MGKIKHILKLSAISALFPMMIFSCIGTFYLAQEANFKKGKVVSERVYEKQISVGGSDDSIGLGYNPRSVFFPQPVMVPNYTQGETSNKANAIYYELKIRTDHTSFFSKKKYHIYWTTKKYAHKDDEIGIKKLSNLEKKIREGTRVSFDPSNSRGNIRSIPVSSWLRILD